MLGPHDLKNKPQQWPNTRLLMLLRLLLLLLMLLRLLLLLLQWLDYLGGYIVTSQ